MLLSKYKFGFVIQGIASETRHNNPTGQENFSLIDGNLNSLVMVPTGQ